MKVPVKMLLAVAFVVGVMNFDAAAQINLDAYGIQFRRYDNAQAYTTHFGDLRLHGGSVGVGYGWLYANRLYINYSSGVTSSINTNLDVGGNLYVSGSKNFIHPHPTDDSKVIKYVAIESDDAITLVRGTAKTVNGEATVTLPEHFSLTTSKNAPVMVTLTPKGAPVLLYVKQDSKEQVIVAMKKSDLTTFGDVEFTFLVTGVRDGFERQDVIVNSRKLYAPNFKAGWEDSEV